MRERRFLLPKPVEYRDYIVDFRPDKNRSRVSDDVRSNCTMSIK